MFQIVFQLRWEILSLLNLPRFGTRLQGTTVTWIITSSIQFGGIVNWLLWSCIRRLNDLYPGRSFLLLHGRGTNWCFFIFLFFLFWFFCFCFCFVLFFSFQCWAFWEWYLFPWSLVYLGSFPSIDFYSIKMYLLFTTGMLGQCCFIMTSS